MPQVEQKKAGLYLVTRFFDCKSSCIKQVVSMVMLGLQEEQTPARVVWSSATTMHGALYVMMDGDFLMLVWSVVS